MTEVQGLQKLDPAAVPCYTAVHGWGYFSSCHIESSALKRFKALRLKKIATEMCDSG